MSAAPDREALDALAAVEAELDQRWPETKIEPSLTRITALLTLLGDPQHAYPSIHIAGTNGKTSVTRMIESLLIALHRRTGRLTSPHLQLATERIAIDGQPISPDDYARVYHDIEPYIQLVDDQSEAADGPRMSKFEVLVAMAYAAFADAPVDVAVIETGMGGTWDATNVINATVTVITPISYDHTDYLGDTLTAIAGEKAGIIKAGDPDPVTILARQPQEAETVLLRAAAEAGTIVARQDSEFGVTSSATAIGGQVVSLQGLSGTYDDIFLSLHGAHQAANASLALAAVEAFFGAGPDRQLDADAVREGFAKATSPGRLERMRAAPTVFIDAAHNPAGAEALAAAIADEFDFQRLVGVIGVLRDKDSRALLEALEPVLDFVIITHNGSPRAYDPEELGDIAIDIFGEDRVEVIGFLPDAVTAAIANAESVASDGSPLSGAGVLITGSVVTAGAARTLFGFAPA